MQKLKEYLRPFLPNFIKQIFILKNDWSCYERLTRPMLDEIDASVRKKLPYSGFNSIIINWYLQKVRENSGC
jgi:asparagine synthase (glutamine-hydrolysing)